MLRKRQRQLLRRNTAAIVRDTDEVPAPLLNLNRNAAGPRIQGILQQFLNHRSRPFNDLPRRYAVHQVGRQLLDRSSLHQDTSLYAYQRKTRMNDQQRENVATIAQLIPHTDDRQSRNGRNAQRAAGVSPSVRSQHSGHSNSPGYANNHQHPRVPAYSPSRIQNAWF